VLIEKIFVGGFGACRLVMMLLRLVGRLGPPAMRFIGTSAGRFPFFKETWFVQKIFRGLVSSVMFGPPFRFAGFPASRHILGREKPLTDGSRGERWPLSFPVIGSGPPTKHAFGPMIFFVVDRQNAGVLSPTIWAKIKFTGSGGATGWV